MYNGCLHHAMITPTIPSPGKFPLNKKADLDELSKQMKVHIVQLKSMLGIANKGKHFNRRLDRKQDELWLLQDGISRLCMKSKCQSTVGKADGAAVTLPSTPRDSFMFEGMSTSNIPSRSSAFLPRSSSLPEKLFREQEVERDMTSLSLVNKSRKMEVKLVEPQNSNSNNNVCNEMAKTKKEVKMKVKEHRFCSDSGDAKSFSDLDQNECWTLSSDEGSVVNMESTQNRYIMKKRTVDSGLSKLEEVEEKLLLLQEKCDMLQQENKSVKKDQQVKNSKKIADLKHRNSELVNVARRLEQRVKALHVENNKRISEGSSENGRLEKEKKNFAYIAAKMQREHDQNISEKDHEIKALKSLVQDLRKALREVKSVHSSQEDEETLTVALKELQKQSLQMQKLAAAGSKKVMIRSLSMPVTARQKVLENANRNLRRQLAQQEGKYRHVWDGMSIEELKSELESTKSKSKTLEIEAKESKILTLNLESQLQIAKVETSDTNIKLNELKKSFDELQAEYSTVHKQLSIAIDERDSAIKQCQDKTNEMEVRIENRAIHVKDGSYDMKDGAQYQATLEKLQAKVLELEKQCQEQSETNRLLNVQLISDVKFSEPVHEREILKCSEMVPSPLPVRVLEHADPVLKSSQIDGKEVDLSPARDLTENQQRLARENGLVSVTRNEDTKIEDFIDEELAEVMDNDVGKLRVYLAKYSYDPFKGPNQSPEAELSLVAGDYVYVYSTMDEDGFFEGELMDGRRGLVPSNFLEPLPDELNGKSPSDTQNLRHSNGEIDQSVSVLSSCTSSGSGGFLQHDVLDSDNSIIVHGTLPYPRKLRIDKQLSHSLIIGWVCPQLSDHESIIEFRVFVNGELKTSVDGTHQKAVVENIHHDKAYRIALCAVSQWGMSDKNLCVFSHGRSAQLAPTEVRMEKVGASNARVAWTASSSQHSHNVTVEEEGQEIDFSLPMKNLAHMMYTVSAPACRLTMGNLRPNVRYKVSVNVKGSHEQSNSYTRFTTPEAGPPDPPFSVQIEECQNANYLLITWFPVTLNTLGTSNGVVVSGYGIHAADRMICEVQSPTIDQCTVRTQTLADAFKQKLSVGSDKHWNRSTKYLSSELRWNDHVPPSITIRTRAVNSQESDPSDPCVIPRELFLKIMDLIEEDNKLVSPSDAKHCTTPPLLRSIESIDVNISFPSDISIPGLQSMKQIEKIRNTRSSTDSAGSVCRSQLGKARILQETHVVPSIEITHDTSSDDDHPVAPSGFGSRSSSNKSVNKRQSRQNSDASKVFSGANSPNVKPNSMVLEENRKHIYKNCDNDDAASVSSSHTSSSSGGDMVLKHGKANTVMLQGTHVIPQRRLQRGESAEYSNPEDFMPSSSNGARRNLILSGNESGVTFHSPDITRKHHHNMRSCQRRPLSGASDEHSQGSHRSRSSSRHGYCHHGRRNGRRDIIRQSTMSSQSGSELASELESTYPLDIDKNKISLFVALYSYNPQLMSPNTDIYEEELNFKEGQLIKVFGSKDEDGFYYGVTHKGIRGYVPCNMVSEVQVDSMQMLHGLHERGFLPSASSDPDDRSEDDTKKIVMSPKRTGDQTNGDDGSKKKYFVALFDYDPQQLSPNIDVDVEISFSRGDIIAVYGDMDDDGFYKGKLCEREGLVPSNFLEEIPKEQAEASQQKPIQLKKNTFKPAPSSDSNNRSDRNCIENHGMDVPTPNTKGRKTGLISRGKKLFKKLGNSQDGKKR